MLDTGATIVRDEERMRPSTSEVLELLCDNAKAQRLLGWTPTVSMDAGLSETIEFIRQHPERFKPDLYAR